MYTTNLNCELCNHVLEIWLQTPLCDGVWYLGHYINSLWVHRTSASLFCDNFVLIRRIFFVCYWSTVARENWNLLLDTLSIYSLLSLFTDMVFGFGPSKSILPELNVRIDCARKWVRYVSFFFLTVLHDDSIRLKLFVCVQKWYETATAQTAQKDR